MNGHYLEGIFAIVFSLSIPIVAILMVFITEIQKKRRETELRLSMVQAGTDAETAKVLIEQQQKKRDKFSGLRSGCCFMGVGLGALCNALLNLDPKGDIYFWLIIAAGMGVGLLAAFVIEYRLTQRERKEEAGVVQQPDI